MSADNWTICPQCKVISEKEAQAAVREAAKAYGKVTPDRYAEMVEAIRQPKPLEESLREDYEIGTGKDGIFYVSYGCGCDTCGFKHSYQFKEQLNIKP